MKPLTVEFTPEELDQFDPHVREALWRLARRGQPEVDPRTATERLSQSIKRGPTEAEFAKRVAQHQLPDGLSIVEQPSLKPRR